MRPDDVAAAVTVATGLLFVVAARHSVKPESSLRPLYGIDEDDDEAATANAAVVVVCGVGLWLLGAAVFVDVPDRIVGTATVLGSAALCVTLGVAIRYGDRRELLTTRQANRETARRVGGAVVLCGLLVVPLAPAIWFEWGPVVVLGAVFGGTFLSLVALAYAARTSEG
jgi:hypothetical protein